ncbi:MAG: IPT/TIG domain-containing protein [Terriglobia bacterium]
MSLWKKAGDSGRAAQKAGDAAVERTAKGTPWIEQVTPRAAIAGGEITLRGSGLTENGRTRPLVRFGDLPASLLLSSPNHLVVRVPEGAMSGHLTVDTGKAVSAPVAVAVGITVAENLHPVANPAVDAAGDIFTTFSGSRGQKVSTSVFKIDRNHAARGFLNDLMNPTGLAFDREGLLYISSRHEGTIYQVTHTTQTEGSKLRDAVEQAQGHRTLYAEGMGIATGIAFDGAGNLYVGDRSGTIFKISRDRQIFVFATLEPSLAAYHLAFGPGGHLYVTAPTTSSYDHVYRVSPAGDVSSFYRGLGRPQGLAFDAEDNLYVAASLAGQRGVVRLTPQAKPELFVSGNNIVGLAFTPQRSLILATNSSLIELLLDIAGKRLVQ